MQSLHRLKLLDSYLSTEKKVISPAFERLETKLEFVNDYFHKPLAS